MRVNTGIGCLIAILSYPLEALFFGIVLRILWGWFVVPSFHVPVPPLEAAVGLSLVVGMFKTFKADDANQKGVDIMPCLVNLFLRPWLILALAAFVRLMF